MFRILLALLPECLSGCQPTVSAPSPVARCAMGPSAGAGNGRRVPRRAAVSSWVCDLCGYPPARRTNPTRQGARSAARVALVSRSSRLMTRCLRSPPHDHSDDQHPAATHVGGAYLAAEPLPAIKHDRYVSALGPTVQSLLPCAEDRGGLAAHPGWRRHLCDLVCQQTRDRSQPGLGGRAQRFAGLGPGLGGVGLSGPHSGSPHPNHDHHPVRYWKNSRSISPGIVGIHR